MSTQGAALSSRVETGGQVAERIRSAALAWTSIYERAAYDQISLTGLLDVNGQAASPAGGPPPARIIRTPGTQRGYGILAPPATRLSFRLKLGERPHFESDLIFLDSDQAPSSNGPRCTVAVSDREERRILWRRDSSGPAHIDLVEYAGQEIDLVLETETWPASNRTCVLWASPRVLCKRRFPAQIACLAADTRKLGHRGFRHAFWSAMKGQLAIEDQNALYRVWVERQRLGRDDVRGIQEAIAGFGDLPRISVLTPVYNTDARWLRRCIESVRDQLYPHWELCLVDDASTSPHVRSILTEYADLDPRIRVSHRDTNGGISNASNQALEVATGEFVGLLDHDDELAPEALFAVARLIGDRPGADVIYTDEDKLESDGLRSEPFFKPDWSPEYLLSCMYTSHFTVYRKKIVVDAGGFRPGYEGSQDYDLMLRVVERTSSVFHIPKVLYHWRKASGSAAGSTGAKPYAYVAARKALDEHLKRIGVRGRIFDGNWRGHYRVRRDVDPDVAVDIVVSARNGVDAVWRSIRSLESETTHGNYKLSIVADIDGIGGALPDSAARVLAPGPDSDSPRSSRAMNRAVRQTLSPYLVFLESGIEIVTRDWLEAMLEFAIQPEIGAVGAKLVSAEGRIQDAGIVLGLGEDAIAGNPLRGFPSDTGYHFGWGNDVRNCSAVGGACMMVRREAFEAVGGFDESADAAVNDLDLCLRMRKKGFRIVWTPYAELRGDTEARQPLAVEVVDWMRSRWGEVLANDPYYNPNLTRSREDFGIR